MPRSRRPQASIVGEREATSIAITLGRALRAARLKRGLTQQALGDRVGLSHARIGELERGHGARAPIETRVALGIALDRPIAITFSRDIEPVSPKDAGHLAGQEILMRLARSVGRRASFELATRPDDPSASVDVCTRDDRFRVLILEEIWNRMGDLGAAARATSRKVAEAATLATVAGGEDSAYRVAHCWVLIDTAANRNMVRAYPEILQAKFPGSSVRWVAALRDGDVAPPEPGIVWLDARSGRLAPIRWPSHPIGPSKASIAAR